MNNPNLIVREKLLDPGLIAKAESSDGHTFVYLLHRYHYHYIVSNDCYKRLLQTNTFSNLLVTK
jgi:hypothetical protein